MGILEIRLNRILSNNTSKQKRKEGRKEGNVERWKWRENKQKGKRRSKRQKHMKRRSEEEIKKVIMRVGKMQEERERGGGGRLGSHCEFEMFSQVWTLGKTFICPYYQPLSLSLSLSQCLTLSYWLSFLLYCSSLVFFLSYCNFFFSMNIAQKIIRFSLFLFYGISTIVDYLKTNPFLYI